jgi:Skp family chaperone for outer membrane proteins
VQQIAAESTEGKLANDKVKALNDQKVKELNDRNRAIQATQQKLDQGGTVLNDQARGQLQAEVERQQRDLQRFTEDAQQDVAALQQQLQEEFQRRLNPVVDRVARENQVHMVFSAADSGLVWADPSLNLTADVIKAFDVVVPAARPTAPAAPR